MKSNYGIKLVLKGKHYYISSHNSCILIFHHEIKKKINLHVYHTFHLYISKTVAAKELSQSLKGIMGDMNYKVSS
jgi:hypothetical protein